MIATMQAHELKLFKEVGIAMEDLVDKAIVTNGVVETKFRIELNLPKINDELKESECAAASEANFASVVSNATTRFREQIQTELAEFISIPIVDPSVNEDGEITKVDIQLNPGLCANENIQCKFYPVIDAIGSQRGGQLRPCYDATHGQVNPNICKLTSGTTVCCSKRIMQNTGKCPKNELAHSISMINRHELQNPEKVYTFSHGTRTAKELTNYCIALTEITIDGKKEKVGSYTDATGDAAKFLPRPRNIRAVDEPTTKQVPRRTRRSNWEYYTSGGWFTSTYIDGQVQKAKDIFEADAGELKAAVAKNSKILLTLQADVKERELMKNAICADAKGLSEALVLAELRSSQNKLEFKSELILRSCSTGIIPDQIDNAVLTKLCAAKSHSKHCYGTGVRSLFSCKLDKPLISIDVVGIAMILTMGIPIEEEYKAYKIYAIGVPFSSKAIDTSTNLTIEETIEQDKRKTPTVDQKAVEQIMINLFKGLGSKMDERQKRETSSTNHFLKVDSVPYIMIEFEGDIITFNEKSCEKTPFGYHIDYSDNDVRNSECIKAIVDSAATRISHFCSISLESGNYDCLVQRIHSGYFVSTKNPISINEVHAKHSVFNNQVNQICKMVCIITVAENQKEFACGKRSYRLSSSPDMDIKLNDVKINKIKLADLTARKSDTSDLLKSGFDFIDSKLTSKQVHQAGSISVGVSLIILISIIICSIRRSWRVFGLIYRYILEPIKSIICFGCKCKDDMLVLEKYKLPNPVRQNNESSKSKRNETRRGYINK